MLPHVCIRLAQVMEQRTDGNGLHRRLVVDHDLPQLPEHVDAVLHQSAGVGQVMLRAGWRGEKIRLPLHPFQKLLCALPVDIPPVKLFELFFSCHFSPPFCFLCARRMVR